MVLKEKLWCLCLAHLFFSPIAAFANSSDTYDYIVVGSGPGGGTLAANLAKAGQSVLLLEAGDDQGQNPNEEIAGFAFLAPNDPLMRWDFFVKLHSDDAINSQYEHLTWRTTDGQFYVGLDPPPGAQLLGVYYPRSGTLGGCSTHNAMGAALPSDSDWQYIADLTGDESWTAANMRQHFIDLETDHSVPLGTPGHGFHGPLDITVNGFEFLQNQSNAYEVMQAAAKVLGQDPAKLSEIVTHRDLNNDSPDRDQQVGWFGFPAHRDPFGRRISARTLVVDVWNATNSDGSKKYPNFSVGLNCFTTKILFDGHKAVPRAIGVEYLAGQSIYQADPRHASNGTGLAKQVFARKEVIISGGTFNSPQLLLLSGIGPKADLESLKIPVLVDLPGVGTNLQDNTEMGVAAAGSQNFTSIGPVCTYGAPGDPCLAIWEAGEGGPYAQGPTGAILWKSSHAALNERDFMIFPGPGSAFQGYWPMQTVNVVPSFPPSTFDFSMVKIHSQNHLGTVKLNTSDPRDTPLINFRFFEGPGVDEDLEAYAEAVNFGRKVFASLKDSHLGPFTENLPCKGNTTCDVKAYIKAQAWSHHATSSCSIGGDKNPFAVLDSKFRVRGTKGLRVVDASAFPRTPGAFPVLPTFVLGMKGSATVLEDANNW